MRIVGVGKRSAGYFVSTRLLVKFLKEKVPVSLVFAQEPALDDEWAELKKMEINESSIRILGKNTGTTGGK